MKKEFRASLDDDGCLFDRYKQTRQHWLSGLFFVVESTLLTGDANPSPLAGEGARRAGEGA